MPELLRVGQLVIAKSDPGRYAHVHYGELLQNGYAFLVLTVREEASALRGGRQSFCGFIDGNGNPDPNHKHRGVVLLSGIPEWMCMDIFEVLMNAPCPHVCAPFCVCLPKTLDGRTVFRAGRNRGVLPVRSAAASAAAERNERLREAPSLTLTPRSTLRPRSFWALTEDDATAPPSSSAWVLNPDD